MLSSLCLQTSLPGVLPGTSGVRLPYRRHLPGIRRVAMTTSFLLPELVYGHSLPPEGAVIWLFSLIVKYSSQQGYSFLLYAWHLTDFIHSYLSLCLFPSSWWIDCLFLLSFFYDMKTMTLSTCLFKGFLFWNDKQYSYYCCFTFQCMASRVTAHRDTKKYTYPSEWQAAQQSVREWCGIKPFIYCKYVFVQYWQTAYLISTDSDIGAK